MIVQRDVLQVTYTWGTGWVNIHVHEMDDQGNTWAYDYQLTDADLSARASGAGKSTWDDQDILAELSDRYPME